MVIMLRLKKTKENDDDNDDDDDDDDDGDNDNDLERAEMLVLPAVVMLKVSGFRFLSSAMSLK